MLKSISLANPSSYPAFPGLVTKTHPIHHFVGLLCSRMQ